MYIMKADQSEIYNTEFFTRIRIVDHPDASLIIGCYPGGSDPVTMARYKHDEARRCLSEIYNAIRLDESYYDMPASTLFFEKERAHDSRTKRRGGS